MLGPVAEVPLLTGCAFTALLALRTVVEGAAGAGTLGVTVAAGRTGLVTGARRADELVVVEEKRAECCAEGVARTT